LHGFQRLLVHVKLLAGDGHYQRSPGRKEKVSKSVLDMLKAMTAGCTYSGEGKEKSAKNKKKSSSLTGRCEERESRA